LLSGDADGADSFLEFQLLPHAEPVTFKDGKTFNDYFASHQCDRIAQLWMTGHCLSDILKSMTLRKRNQLTMVMRMRMWMKIFTTPFEKDKNFIAQVTTSFVLHTKIVFDDAFRLSL